MSQTSAMKQIGARNMNCVVEQMEWSNKMDLIAFGNDKGEVIVQRLNWQKIVTFPSPGEDVQVRSLSWQWDETVIAVGYSNGKVALLDVEHEELISGMTYDEDIKKVYFSKAINAEDYRNIYRNRTELNFDFFLPQLPSLSSISMGVSKASENHKSFAKSSPCFLIVLLASGKLHLLLLGALKAGTIDLTQHISHPDEFEAYDARLSGNFNSIYALVRDGTQLKVLHFNNKVLQQYISPMLHLAVHCANILETKNYMNETVQCMLESWETVLIEMDNKLTKYANQQPAGSLSADFLELLVFGYATHEIEEFLMDDLTEKGLKKLATSVDLSYSTIQSLVAKPLQSAAVNMFYFLNTTKGLSRINYFFEHLISFDAAENAVRACGAFLMKVLELQQVIDQSVDDIKLFFCWICVVIIRLHQQDTSDDMTQLTPEDAINLAEYLNSFEDSVIVNEDGTITKRKFNLEKVGQYLENKNLHQVSKSDMHHLWNKLLEENECLRNCTLLYPHEKQSSLIQQRDKMFSAIDDVFKKPTESITTSFELNATILCAQNLPSVEVVDRACVYSSFYINDTAQTDILLTTISTNEVIVMEFDRKCTILKCLRLQLTPGPFTVTAMSSAFANLRFVNLQLYNENMLSMLLQTQQEDNRSQSYFVQFSLEAARSKFTLHSLSHQSAANLCDNSVAHSIHDISDSAHFKNLDGVAANLAVSGSRKVATVLSDGKRKMTIFEMEIDDDEEDTEISHNSFLEISKESAAS